MDVIELAGELELDSAGEEESDSDSEEEGEELPNVESNPGMLVSDMSGMEATMGESADALPTADQLRRA